MALRLQIRRLMGTVRRYKEDVRSLKWDHCVKAFLDVGAAAEHNNAKASFILGQVTNYNKKDQHGQTKL